MSPAVAPYSRHLLTDRELEVVDAVARGLSVKAIARELGCSQHTIATHLENIAGKVPHPPGRRLPRMRRILLWYIDQDGD